MKEIRKRSFANGTVYALKTEGDYPIEVTDTFLPFYTKDAIGQKQNFLKNNEFGDRSERWMIGVSVASGCPIGCKFCATAKLKKYKALTSEEIIEQVEFVVNKNKQNPLLSKEFKINYTRMGDIGLNLTEVRKAIDILTKRYPNIHHYVSTIGIKGFDFSWIKDNVTLQLSLHSLDENKRDELIPYKRKMSIEELGAVRTKSNLKTTINLTLVETDDWDVQELKKFFDPEFFFMKISPINTNEISEMNNLGKGIIKGANLV